MAKNLNLKELKAIKDSKRIEDMRSGGSGSLRSSIFNRQDEALPPETIKEFEQKFWAQGGKIDVGGGDLKGSDGKKHVCGVVLKIPEKVTLNNNVDALLAKVDYDKNNKIFKAYYRPKNGRWGQVKNAGTEF